MCTGTGPRGGKGLLFGAGGGRVGWGVNTHVWALTGAQSQGAGRQGARLQAGDSILLLWVQKYEGPGGR